MEKDLQLMEIVVDSYVDCERDRTTGGGGTMQPMKMKNIVKCQQSIRIIFKKFQKYRDLRNRNDDQQD